MEPVMLTSRTSDGHLLTASFLPAKGMNMVSFKKDDQEVIDQKTRSAFEARFAGLGALIGPHFHRRKVETLPSIKEEQLFPHIANMKAYGSEDPFSHGIARYAPWKFEATQTMIRGTLSGKDLWNEVSLADLEGQQFQMSFSAEFKEERLNIALSVVSEKDSVVGLHYYYKLPEGKGKVASRVQKHYLENSQRLVIPAEWEYDDQQLLTLSLAERAYDCTFHSFPNPLESEILLENEEYSLKVKCESDTQENAWQLYHPEKASFVCIEPISAQDPRHPNLTVSALRVQLEIL